MQKVAGKILSSSSFRRGLQSRHQHFSRPIHLESPSQRTGNCIKNAWKFKTTMIMFELENVCECLELLLKSLHSLHFSIEPSSFCHFPIAISTFWSLSCWNLYCLIKISTFSSLAYWNLYFVLYSSTVWSLFYWNLYFVVTFLLKSLLLYCLITFLLKSLLSLHFSIEISTFCHFLITFVLKSLLPQTVCCTEGFLR